MKRRRQRVAPSLDAEPVEHAPAVYAPTRQRKQPHAQPAPQARPRRAARIAQAAVWALLGLMALLLMLVLALRWIPPPTTAFMLQSPTTPVQHRWVSDHWIAMNLKRAVVASEDQKFFEHRGFDFEAIGDALEENRQGGHRRGASTISQQTAKNLFLWSGGGYFRKGLEAVLTVVIETLWSKDRILEVYLNIAEFGPGIYGAEAAAQTYFAKPAARLTPGEAALLAAVLPSPRRWDVRDPGPYVRSRSAWILQQMGIGQAPEATADAPKSPAGPDGTALPAESGPAADSADVEGRPLDDAAMSLQAPRQAYELPATEDGTMSPAPATPEASSAAAEDAP